MREFLSIGFHFPEEYERRLSAKNELWDWSEAVRFQSIEEIGNVCSWRVGERTEGNMVTLLEYY